MSSSQPYHAHSVSAPVVVQGTVVQGHDAQSNTHPVSTYDYNKQGSSEPLHVEPNFESEFTKGEAQPKRCNDIFWAIFFFIHLGVIAFLSVTYIPQMYGTISDGGGRALEETTEASGVWLVHGMENVARSLTSALGITAVDNRQLEESNDENAAADLDGLIFVLGTTFVAGFSISALTLTFMMAFAEQLIKIALWFNILTSLLVGVMGLLMGALETAVMGFIFFALSAYYASVVWHRIPFAASNLVTAVTSVRANIGLTFFAYSSLFFIFCWSLWWSFATTATFFVAGGCNANFECENEEASTIIVFLLLVSYFWTSAVIKNTVHVTVAGTVGTWWFSPLEASSCCSGAVRQSFIRSVTTSFGSICFGSLIVAIIQAIKHMVRSLRENGDSCLLCCVQCIIGCIEYLVEYFNRWAFVYVGLYGYSFMDAGKNVMTLFKSRGWTTIITDNLIDRVLGMLAVAVGVLTGVTGIIVANTLGVDLGYGVPFLMGLSLGFVICATLMGVVSSAVNTVIVCYAEAPNEFQTNHPKLSDNMRATWRQAWPNDFKY